MHIGGIATKLTRRGPMTPLAGSTVSKENGIANDCRGGGRSKQRQVTVISAEQWEDALAELGARLTWYSRRAGICISGHRFGPEDIGKHLHLGDNVILQITGETTPCDRMDEIRPGLKAALTPHWRGGVTCRVIQGGTMYVSDDVRLMDPLVTT